MRTTKIVARTLLCFVLAVAGVCCAQSSISQVNGVYMVDGTTYATVQAAISACLASSNTSCTVDARGSGGLGSAADVIGTFDPGSKGLTLLLGSYSDYTIGQITLRSNLSIEGAGSNETALTSSSSTNQATFVLPQANNSPAISVTLKGFRLYPASGATTQIGADLECNSNTNSGMWYSTWEDVWFGPAPNSFPGGGIKLSCPNYASAIQFSQFRNVVAFRANGSTSPALYICGSGLGNDQFYGGEFDAANWSDTTIAPDVFIGACSGYTGNAYSLNFYGTTMQGGTNLIELNGANNIQFDRTHHEGTAGVTNGFQFVCGGSQNQGISIDRPAFGTIGTALSTFTGSISGTTLTVTGTPTGTIAAGTALVSTAGSTGITDGTLILAQTSGSTGGAGTYTINNMQTVSSEPMIATGYTLDTAGGCNQDSVLATNMSGPAVTQFISGHYQNVTFSGETTSFITYGVTNFLTNGSSTLNLYNLSRADVYTTGGAVVTAFSNTPATNIPITLCAGAGTMNFATGGGLILGGASSLTVPYPQCAAFSYDDYFKGWILTSQTSPTITGTTGTILGTSLSGSCDTGTVSVSGAAVGSPVVVSSTTGADVGGTFNVRASVTSAGTVTVYVCGTGTPPSLAYNVTVR